jgi:hypothetical protein
MNLGQTMITMGMFVLLVMSVISANRMLMQNSETGLQTEALTESSTIANDLFAEAQSKKFDKNDNGSGTQSPGEFTAPGGTDWGPSHAFPLPDSTYYGHSALSIDTLKYDDVDDYNGYTRIVGADSTNGIRIGGYLVTVRVFYVNPSNPDVTVSYQTNFKRIEVDVEHPQYLPKITYTSLMSY